MGRAHQAGVVRSVDAAGHRDADAGAAAGHGPGQEVGALLGGLVGRPRHVLAPVALDRRLCAGRPQGGDRAHVYAEDPPLVGGLQHVLGAAHVDPFHVLGPVGAQLVESGGVVHHLDAVECLLDRRPIGDVAFGVLDGQRFEPATVAGGADEHAHVAAPSAQGGGRPAAEETRGSGHE